MQQLLLVGPHLGHVLNEKVSPPSPNKMRPNTGEDPEQVSRIEPPSKDGPSPSTKIGPVSLPEAKTLEEREGLTWGTSEPSNATGE